ncbi:hypothetical protein TNCT_542651 [Trichonephila clavata]|uniref:Uncharacterized protein n=1 Tax=Trichonephila clavata TaxID=2740835 RepID=A0A8X6FP14_TRICU|nr:hypothetical protein TNCT_542651 [Trichonephila clavata]
MSKDLSNWICCSDSHSADSVFQWYWNDYSTPPPPTYDSDWLSERHRRHLRVRPHHGNVVTRTSSASCEVDAAQRGRHLTTRFVSRSGFLRDQRGSLA